MHANLLGSLTLTAAEEAVSVALVESSGEAAGEPGQ